MTTTTTFNLLEPYQIAEETFVIPWALEAPPVGHFPMNSMVIRGAEPVLVDTGAPAVRPQWLEAAWSVVDPLDVRWIFLTHDDRDHAGNLSAGPRGMPERDAADHLVLDRPHGRGVGDADQPVPLHERRRHHRRGRPHPGRQAAAAVRQPDDPRPVRPEDQRACGRWTPSRRTCPLRCPKSASCRTTSSGTASSSAAAWSRRGPRCWTTRSSGAVVDDIQRLDAEVIAGCHSPVLRGPRIAEAFDLLRQLPDIPPWQEFTQADLDQWMAAAEGSVPPEQPRPSAT